MVAPISDAGPLMTLSRPAGRPASWKTSAILIPVTGVSSDGFRTKPLPAASAITTFFIASKNGALNGAMPAITPSGWRMVKPNWPGAVSGMVSPGERRNSEAAVRNRSKQYPTSNPALPATEPDSSISTSEISLALAPSTLAARINTSSRADTGIAAQAL